MDVVGGDLPLGTGSSPLSDLSLCLRALRCQDDCGTNTSPPRSPPTPQEVATPTGSGRFRYLLPGEHLLEDLHLAVSMWTAKKKFCRIQEERMLAHTYRVLIELCFRQHFGKIRVKTQKYSKCSTRRKYEGLPSPGCSDPKLLRLRVKLASRFVTTESPQSAVEPAAAPSDEGRDCLQWSPLEGAPGQVAKGPLLEMSLLSLGRVRSIHAPKHLLYPEPADEECILIGDYSKKHLLPIAGMHHLGLHCVLAQTVASLITGKFSAAVEDFLIVDCRYPYEYQGGHIKGAVNLHTEAQLHRAFHHGLSHSQLSPTTGPKLSLSGDTTVLGMRRLSHGDESQSNSSPDIPAESSPRKLVVFHCEFSSERGPRLCRYLRELDRKVNAGRYPLLYHPEIYLLQGGYKQFYNSFPELCEPHGYVPMRHKEFREQLHRFHQKKRSRQCRRVLFK
ncbi:cell division cycle 25 homolog d isoform X2 [Denticeps clupeoides]|uniref:cell division cycle 25 homolog d isoform X2 n=1 Tax=Denticeps clupeoides TaxID=299321 RepID=UPI0010A5602F|nr:M-phase inducer phosphatase 3-like isoform X2 [Denticeps clupeoides]